MKTKNTVEFKAGKYYIGDPCYVIKDDTLWQKFCNDLEKTNYGSKKPLFINGIKVFSKSTHHGDGIYFDQFKKKYLVDSGMIGCVPVELVQNKRYKTVLFEKDFEAYEKDGIFYIEKYIIDTTTCYYDIEKINCMMD